MNKIKRTKERVKQTAEVFTPDYLVNEMLDQLPPEVWEQNKTFLDPAAGDGNILVEIIKRKIQNNYTAYEALKTTFGIDLMEDNVERCRERLIEAAGLPSNDYEAKRLVQDRVVQGNALEVNTEALFGHLL